MCRADGGTTSPTLLRRVRDWQDSPAWREFFDRYNPLLHRWCREMQMDDASTAELCQRIWIELAERIRSFRYDPGRRFRGWLRLLFQSRATDLFREQKRNGQLSLDDARLAESISGLRWNDRVTTDDESPPIRAAILEISEAAQNAVRERVSAESWRAFWMIAVEDRPVREVADVLDKTYAAAFHGHRRVEKLLNTEAQRRLAELGDSPSATDEPE